MNKLVEAARQLADSVRTLHFSDPVAYVYSPLDYAWAGHEAYIRKFGAPKKRVLFMGMNPGPWGMAQTGIPFGEIAACREWMRIDEPVRRPVAEHPKRPVDGFACARSEVSGRRLWGLFAERFGTAEAFFRDHFVINYCPLVFMAASSKNITPDKLPAAEAAPLFEASDRHVCAVLDTLRPEWVVGIGAFAEGQLKKIVRGDIKIGKVLHPSPASPAANRGWAEAATRQLVAQGIW
ncbi:MAG: single-strand selective monofunctional uracil-DNA glycosylase [Spartobacteria bacterium]|nr:single-strand selective monofunctional uracil-DNA glycosylase [Spartobacteria bacterium]